MKTKLNIKFWWKQIDKVNFALILMLAIIGIILSISLSDSYLFLNKHLIFSIIGIFIILKRKKQNLESFDKAEGV